MTLEPGAQIPTAVRIRLRDVALEWARRNGDPRPTLIGAAATIRDTAVKWIYGDLVGAGDDPIFLVVMSGSFTLNDALDSGAATAPTGHWAALYIEQETLEVRTLTLRPTAPEEVGPHLDRFQALTAD